MGPLPVTLGASQLTLTSRRSTSVTVISLGALGVPVGRGEGGEGGGRKGGGEEGRGEEGRRGGEKEGKGERGGERSKR